MNCLICPVNSKSLAKYKCPTCRIPYCSLGCWKKHQTAGCKSAVKSQGNSESQYNTSDLYNFPTEDTVPLETLKSLEQNQELKNILCNRHLREMLVAIDNSTDPAAAMQQAMLEPIFVEFADECLKVVEPSEN